MMTVIEKRTPMIIQDADERIHNFSEVALGYDEESALKEAHRCLHCVNHPCISGCPVNIRIPDFIEKIKNGEFEEAYKIISESSSLPAICGRVCPQEKQCEANCTLGIRYEPVAIGRLERFVADLHNRNDSNNTIKREFNDHSVAIVGSGPSGLACAGDLIRKGYKVTIFEALHTPGGVLVYGIPEFRLPKEIVKKEIDNLQRMGVEIRTDIVIGKTLTIDELCEMGFEAVFVGSGAGLPRFMNIPGESLKGVYSANEFLTRTNLMKAYKEDSDTPIMKGGVVTVVGGGNVAMDAARTALRLNAEKVYIVYRRSENELPARKEEIEHAKEESVEFKLLNNPVEIISCSDTEDPGYGFVKGIKCVKMELGEADESGRRSPVEIPGSEYIIDTDTVIMAIGNTPNPLIRNSTEGLETNKMGGLIINEDGMTSKEGVFAGGDAVTGAATVISAMGAGKKAAEGIDKYLRNR